MWLLYQESQCLIPAGIQKDEGEKVKLIFCKPQGGFGKGRAKAGKQYKGKKKYKKQPTVADTD